MIVVGGQISGSSSVPARTRIGCLGPTTVRLNICAPQTLQPFYKILPLSVVLKLQSHLMMNALPMLAHSGLSGSITTGIGYSKGHGRSTYNAANLNLCKTTYNDEGKPRTFNLDINVSRSDGPGYYYGPGYGPGPMMRGAPRP